MSRAVCAFVNFSDASAESAGPVPMQTPGPPVAALNFRVQFKLRSAFCHGKFKFKLLLIGFKLNLPAFADSKLKRFL